MIFDLDHKLVHGTLCSGRDSVFDDLGEAVQDLLDCSGIDVHAADDEHVVGTAQDSAVEKYESAWAACIPARADDVASAIADDRRTDSAECCEDQLGQFAFFGWIACFD